MNSLPILLTAIVIDFGEFPFYQKRSSNSCLMIVTFEQNQTKNVFDIFWYEIFLLEI